MTYTAGNFGGVDFQIRGIGVTAVGYDSESGVAINFDEVFLSAPQLTEGSFYDLSGVEVLAGPQSTLYGRGATGGVVNVNIAKPDLENAMVQVIGDIGNYDANKVQGTVNIPIITDQLALRVSGEWDKRDGFVTNLFNGDKVDGLNQYSVRPTLRWQPSEKTTIDITGQFTREDDTHMRADKQLCTTDPDRRPRLSSGFGWNAAVESEFNTERHRVEPAGLVERTRTGGGQLARSFYNITQPNVLPPGFVDPTGDRQINTDFTPRWQSQDNFLSGKWHQSIMPWLDGTLILGYDHDSYLSQQSYNNIPGQALPTNNTPGTVTLAPGLTVPASCLAALGGAPSLSCAQGAFFPLLAGAAIGGGVPVPAAIAYANNFAPFLSTPGQLPISQIGNLGLTGGNFRFTGSNEAFDQSDGESSQYSGELRFATSFTGPLNAMLGFYYLHTVTTGDYYVNAPTLDYPSIILGAFGGLANPNCFATGCILAPGYYHNIGVQSTLTSKAVFGEVYYDLIPDTLKLTGGLRLTNDDKFNTGRILLYTQDVTIGSTNENAVGTNIPVSQQFTAWTGRAVIDWTPKLDFTDSSLVYLSYSTGYKAGGANPNIQPGTPGIPSQYAPENIIAYEVGTKNMIFKNSLQANGDVYYYNYAGLQVATIQQNTAVNDNIAAHVWGAEGSLLWQATDRLQFGISAAHEESNIVHTSLLDPANPTGGNPNTLLIKDDSISATTGNNCVLYFNGAFPGLPAGYVAPSIGQNALASQGIPHVAFGSCNAAALTAATAGTGYTLTGPNGSTTAGQIVNLDNHALQNTPQLSFSVNAQYTQPLPSDYSLIARTDVHFQTHFWGSIFQDGAALVGSEYTWDASLQLSPPDDVWYVQAYIKNITDQNNVTGQYVSSQTSGLYTNAFYADPRTYGVELGIKFD